VSNKWKREVKDIISDLWGELEEISRRCPEKQPLIREAGELIRYYINYGPGEFETPEYVGGVLTTVAKILVSGSFRDERKLISYPSLLSLLS
jgi:hypothetical protein